MKTVHAVLSCDDNYAPYAAVVIASAIDSLDSGWSLDFVVFHGGLSLESEARLRRLENSRLTIRLIDLSACKELHSLPELGHWTTAMYYRFFVAEAFTAEVKRAIYLDCDLLIMRSLHHLYGEEMGGASLGVVENPGTHRLAALGIQKSIRYFNSGVLLIDLAAWSKRPILQLAMAEADRLRGALVNPDQDILNVLFDGDVKFLDVRWNVQVSMYLNNDYRIEMLASPWIIHFTTQLKPWAFADPHPFSDFYRQYAAERGVDLIFKSLTLVDRFKYPIRFMRRYGLFHLRYLRSVNHLWKARS